MKIEAKSIPVIMAQVYMRTNLYEESKIKEIDGY